MQQTKKTLLMAVILILSSCSATEVYRAAEATNETALAGAVGKVCSELSGMAVRRNWSKDQIASRELFCESLGYKLL